MYIAVNSRSALAIGLVYCAVVPIALPSESSALIFGFFLLTYNSGPAVGCCGSRIPQNPLMETVRSRSPLFSACSETRNNDTPMASCHTLLVAIPLYYRAQVERLRLKRNTTATSGANVNNILHQMTEGPPLRLGTIRSS